LARFCHLARSGVADLVTIRILLVDDQDLLRLGFRMILESEDDMEIAGEARDGARAVELAMTCHPDVVLMDVRMPLMDGIEATRQIVQNNPAVRVLVLTTFDLDEYAFGALGAGASGFLLKDVPPEQLLSAIRAVAAGDAVVSPRITRLLLDNYSHLLAPPAESAPAQDLAELTDRERQVLIALAEGLSNSEIGARLFISEATVKTHVGKILGKFGLRDRLQAVVFAFQMGIVRPDGRNQVAQGPGNRR
jgi:DNA-binding NarL/FixJ family response regulator